MKCDFDAAVLDIPQLCVQLGLYDVLPTPATHAF